MAPHLVAITGVIAGSVFDLDAATTTIGREPANQVAVPEISVSRRHCTIRRTGNGFELRDLESTHGTFVNGLRVTSCPLTHGDRITLGAACFVFQDRDEMVAVPAAPVTLSDLPIVAERTVEIRLEDALYLRAPDARGAMAANDRTGRDLDTLLRASTALAAIRDLEPLA